jgi:uncharacterized protein (DUF1697 family)
MKFIALLRGVNVGGKNILPMKALASMFEEAGGVDVKTLIQSGNVVFAASSASAAKKAVGDVSSAIVERFGFRSPIVVRSAPELAKIVEENPFLRAKVDPNLLHLAFLGAAPKAASIAALDPKRSPGDELVVKRTEIYLHLPNGVVRTKLTNDYFDRTLATTSTVRNWRTVMKLLDLVTAKP